MADFSSFSDSDDERRAVEEILSQAMDSCVLEQVAAVNCAGFDPDSVLPTHIEARFRKLKSFPAAAPSSSSSSNRHSASSGPNLNLPSTKSMGRRRSTHDQSTHEEKPKQENEYVSSPSNSSNSSAAKENSSPMKETLSSGGGQRVFKSKAKSRSSFTSPSDSSNRYKPYSSPSPPKKSGCFWCSPKKKKKKSKQRGKMATAFVSEWGSDGDDELFSDLNLFSKKEREKVLKKAMKEDEKISREAEKIVKWAKQVSGRMNIKDDDFNGSHRK